MLDQIEKDFIKEVIKLVDKYSFEKCAYCDPGTLVSIDGMMDFKCISCGRSMTESDYLGEIIKLVYDFIQKTNYDTFK